MLTDIFADRYKDRVLWPEHAEAEAKLLNQCFRIISEQLFPYWIDGKESAAAKIKWTTIHDRLSTELGIDELAPKYYSYQTTWMGKPHTQSSFWTMDKICKDFVCALYSGQCSPDRFVKERISFVELAFRFKEEELQVQNNELPAKIEEAKRRFQLNAGRGIRLPGDPADGLRAVNATMNAAFRASVDELNERLRRAGVPLNYHNGFLQISTDSLTQTEIEQAFWSVVSDPIWKNVDIDMKEALDRRDANDRDPVFYAARALESAIKIVSEKKGWTHGGEKGAHNYIDNLGSAKNGAFIGPWERDVLKAFFTEIRNPFGHGPGSAEMPQLSAEQTDWAIESCMSWIKSLVARMKVHAKTQV
jgi:hypothetical protein